MGVLIESLILTAPIVKPAMPHYLDWILLLLFPILSTSLTQILTSICPADLNFNYFTTHDFHANEDIINCLTSNSLPFLNCNIRSVQANFDNLVNMLSELYFPISVLGVTETKLKNDQDALANINLTGYNFLSQPSGTNAGGVGFYVKDNLVYE